MNIDRIDIEFVHEFMQEDGVPVQRLESECVEFLQNLGCSEIEALERIEKACAENWIFESSSEDGINTYN